MRLIETSVSFYGTLAHQMFKNQQLTTSMFRALETSITETLLQVHVAQLVQYTENWWSTTIFPGGAISDWRWLPRVTSRRQSSSSIKLSLHCGLSSYVGLILLPRLPPDAPFDGLDSTVWPRFVQTRRQRSLVSGR